MKKRSYNIPNDEIKVGDPYVHLCADIVGNAIVHWRALRQIYRTTESKEIAKAIIELSEWFHDPDTMFLIDATGVDPDYLYDMAYIPTPENILDGVYSPEVTPLEQKLIDQVEEAQKLAVARTKTRDKYREPEAK